MSAVTALAIGLLIGFIAFYKQPRTPYIFRFCVIAGIILSLLTFILAAILSVGYQQTSESFNQQQDFVFRKYRKNPDVIRNSIATAWFTVSVWTIYVILEIVGYLRFENLDTKPGF